MADRVLEESGLMYETMVRELVELWRGGAEVDVVVASVEMAARFALLMAPGRYADGKIENVALRIGEELEQILFARPLSRRPAPPPSLPNDGRRKVLHVATAVHRVGGHTRLIWNWIRNDPDSCHSLLVTNQGMDAIPRWLTGTVRERGGLVVSMPAADPVSRAWALREIIRSNVDIVILHHHPDDAVPILALAVSQCPPVAILNHSDHLFWLGGSIADAVIDLRPSGRKLTQTRRSIRNSLLLPIPVDAAAPTVTRAEARARLNVPNDHVMLLSIGSAFKYVPTGRQNFYRTVTTILNRNREAHLYLIGVDRSEASKHLGGALHERLHLEGVIEDTSLYRSAADLYLEGFPVHSDTALLEAAAAGVCPVLALAPQSRLLVADDAVLESVVRHRDTEEEYIDEVELLIRRRGEREQRGRMIRERVIGYHAGAEWKRNLDAVYDFLDGRPHEPGPIPDSLFTETDDDVSLSRVCQQLKDHRVLWSWLCRINHSVQELAEAIPAGERFILVDGDEWGAEEFVAGRRRLPFLERDGRYWGPPPDDASGIQEFERLRQAGATFMVFAWPAFWWLDYYSGLANHLRSKFRCVLGNDRLIVFDLRPECEGRAGAH